MSTTAVHYDDCHITLDFHPTLKNLLNRSGPGFNPHRQGTTKQWDDELVCIRCNIIQYGSLNTPTLNKWPVNTPQSLSSLRLWELNQGLIDTTPPEEVDPDIQTIISVEHNSSLPPNLADTYGTAQTNARLFPHG